MSCESIEKVHGNVAMHMVAFFWHMGLHTWTCAYGGWRVHVCIIARGVAEPVSRTDTDKDKHGEKAYCTTTTVRVISTH